MVFKSGCKLPRKSTIQSTYKYVSLQAVHAPLYCTVFQQKDFYQFCRVVWLFKLLFNFVFPFRNFLNRFGECNLLRKINSLTSGVQFDVANFLDNFLSSVNLVSRNPFSIGVSSRSRCRRVNMQNKILYNFNIFS